MASCINNELLNTRITAIYNALVSAGYEATTETRRLAISKLIEELSIERNKILNKAGREVLPVEPVIISNKLNDDVVELPKYELFPGAYANSEQREAIDKIDTFLKGNDQFFVLEGLGGTGKTTLINKALQEAGIPKNKLRFTATTHKAASVLSNALGARGKNKARTLDSLFGMRPINNKDMFSKNNGISFFFGKKAKDLLLPDNGVIVIDEASMIAEDKLEGILHVLDQLRDKNIKIIFMGDSNQLPPVRTTTHNYTGLRFRNSPNNVLNKLGINSRINSNSDSPIFTWNGIKENNRAKLQQVMRQKPGSTINGFTNKILRGIARFKQTANLEGLYNFITDYSDLGKIEFDSKNNKGTNITSNEDLFHSQFIEDYINNPEQTRMITYLNENNNSYGSVKDKNDTLRSKLYDRKKDLGELENVSKEYFMNNLMAGDIVLTYNGEVNSPMDDSERPTVNNSMEYTINDTNKIDTTFQEYFREFAGLGNNLDIYAPLIQRGLFDTPISYYHSTLVPVNGDPNELYTDTVLVSNTNKNAINRVKDILEEYVSNKSFEYRDEYLNLIKSLGRAVEANYNYAVTSHKSQGSTIRNAYIEGNTFFGLKSYLAKSIANGLYVAFSRPTEKLVIHSNNTFGSPKLPKTEDIDFTKQGITKAVPVKEVKIGKPINISDLVIPQANTAPTPANTPEEANTGSPEPPTDDVTNSLYEAIANSKEEQQDYDLSQLDGIYNAPLQSEKPLPNPSDNEIKLENVPTQFTNLSFKNREKEQVNRPYNLTTEMFSSDNEIGTIQNRAVAPGTTHKSGVEGINTINGYFTSKVSIENKKVNRDGKEVTTDEQILKGNNRGLLFNVKDLFSNFKDIISSLNLTDQQTEAFRKLYSFNNRFNVAAKNTLKVFNPVTGKGKEINGKIKKGKPLFFNKISDDPTGLLYKFKGNKPLVDENLHSIMSMVGLSWLLEDGKNTLVNDDSQINAILNRSSDIIPTAEEVALLGEGTPINVVARTIGRNIYKALRIKLRDNVNKDIEAQMQISLGLEVIRILDEAGFIEIKEINFSTIKTEKEKEKEAKTRRKRIKEGKEKEGDIRDVTNFIKLKEDNPIFQDIERFYKNTSNDQTNSLSYAIESLLGAKYINRIAPKFVSPKAPKRFLKERFEISPDASKNIDLLQKQAHVFNDMGEALLDNYFTVGDSIVPTISDKNREELTNMLRNLLGYKFNLKDYPLDLMDSNKGKNFSIDKEINDLIEFYPIYKARKEYDLTGDGGAFYYSYAQYSNGRIGTTSNTFDYQSSKLHRFFSKLKSWDNEITKGKNNEDFYMGLMQAFGGKPELITSRDQILPAWRELEKELKPLEKAITRFHKTGKPSEELLKFSAGEEKTHTLMALYEYGKYLNTPQGNKFTTFLPVEADAVTQGVVFGFIQAGMMDNVNKEVMTKAGVFFDERVHYGDFKNDPNNRDNYEELSVSVTDTLSDWRDTPNKQTAVLDTLIDEYIIKYGNLPSRKAIDEKLVPQANVAADHLAVIPNKKGNNIGLEFSIEEFQLLFGSSDKELRNIMKDPLMRMSYQAGVDALVSLVSTSVLYGIRGNKGILDKIVEARKNAESEENSTKKREYIEEVNKYIGAINRILIAGGSSDVLNANFDPRKHSLGKRKAVIVEVLDNTYGIAFRHSLNRHSAKIKPFTTYINNMSATIFHIFNYAFTKKRAELMGKKGFLTLEEERELHEDKLIKSLMPFIPFANSDKAENGVLALKTVKDLDSTTKAQVNFGKPFKINGKSQLSLTTHLNNKKYAEPGVSVIVKLIQGLDSAIIQQLFGDDIYHIFDAIITGVGNVEELAQKFNAKTVDTHLNYSITDVIEKKLGKSLNTVFTNLDVPNAKRDFEIYLINEGVRPEVYTSEDMGNFTKNAWNPILEFVVNSIGKENPIDINRAAFAGLDRHRERPIDVLGQARAVSNVAWFNSANRPIAANTAYIAEDLLDTSEDLYDLDNAPIAKDNSELKAVLANLPVNAIKALDRVKAEINKCKGSK